MQFTKQTLDRVTAAGCSVPGCDHSNHSNAEMYIHARCHPSGQIEVSYRHGTGVIEIACRECHKVIATVKVAEE